MLNTVMALWNQNPGENRRRIIKLLFTFLFISVSIFLLLFTLNSSAWTLGTRKEQIQTKKEGPVGMTNHRGIATVGNTPISYSVDVGTTPTATRTSVQVCVNTPTVVVPPSVVPQKVMIYARKSGLKPKSSKPRHVRPMTVHIRKSKPHPRKKSHVRVVATPAPQQTVVVMPPPTPVPATPQPQATVTPAVVVSVTEMPIPTEGTAVSSMPDIVIISATPDTSMTSTNSFVHSLRKKEAIRIPVSPAPESTKKNTVKKSDHMYEKVECSKSTTYKEASEGTIVKAKRHAVLLLESSLSGTFLFCCFLFVRRREK